MQFPVFQAGGDPTHTFKGVSVIGLFRPVPKVTGRFYALSNCGTTNGAIAAIDTLYFWPFFMPEPFTFTAGKVSVVTGGAASSIKGGIWANSQISNLPVGAPLVADNTGVATTASATNVTLALAGTLQSGFYWVGIKGTGTLPTVAGLSTGDWTQFMMGGVSMGTQGFSLADTYSNNLPTLAEGQAFTNSGAVMPKLSLVSA